jgi:uncharacterized repeat protein (TIGR03803 family)
MTCQAFSFRRSPARCFAVLALLGASSASAQNETVIHAFQTTSVTDGISPDGGLVTDSSGALYGATATGGKYHAGTIYKLAPPATQGGAWKQNILYSFDSSAGAANPSGSLVLTKNGKIYGATSGQNSAVVFELAPPTQSGGSWTESIVYKFYGSVQTSVSSLIFDGKGRLYGTTNNGGRYQSGSVFALSPQPGLWKEQDVYSFRSNNGGLVLPGGLVLGPAGVLYGITSDGGTNGSSLGTVFSLTPPSGGGKAWTQSTLYTLDSTAFHPVGTLVLDNAGAIYGTTLEGGLGGSGTVFQLVPPATQGGAWTENVLYSFQNGSDGSQPISGVIFDGTGALYGTTQYGGDFGCSYNGVNDGCGAAFKLIPSTQGGTWAEQSLHTFTGSGDGVNPGQAPLLVLNGILYGTTVQGGDSALCSGAGCGTVFEITQ